MKTILIIDNDMYRRRKYEKEFCALGFRVLTARNGIETLKICSRENPELVIMSPLLPDISGVHLIDWLRKIKSHMSFFINSNCTYMEDDIRRIPKTYYVFKSPNLNEIKKAVYHTVEASAN